MTAQPFAIMKTILMEAEVKLVSTDRICVFGNTGIKVTLPDSVENGIGRVSSCPPCLESKCLSHLSDWDLHVIHLKISHSKVGQDCVSDEYTGYSASDTISTSFHYSPKGRKKHIFYNMEMD